MAEFESFIREWTDKKLRASLLPPDPARVAEFMLRGPVTIEHVIPVPPLLERLHTEFTQRAIERLPRLPATGDFPIEKWLEWVYESF